jgi:hypothetical protein
MQFELFVDPNETEFVSKHADLIRQKLTTSLLLVLQALHADDVKRTTFIGHGMDGDAVRLTAEREQRAKEDHERIFAQPQEEIERNKHQLGKF